MKRLNLIALSGAFILFLNVLPVFSQDGCDEECSGGFVSTSIVATIGSCTYTVYYEYCPDNFLYRIIGFGTFEPDCNDILIEDVLYYAHKAILLSSWTLEKRLNLSIGNCTEAYSGQQAACWKLVEGGPNQWPEWEKCDPNSCCVYTWLICRTSATEYQTFLQSVASQDICDPGLAWGCYVVCPE